MMAELRHEDPGTERPEGGLFSRADLVFFAVFCALFLFVFREFFFTSRVFFERDTTLIEIPARKLTVQLLKEGNFALWTDAYGNGQPFLANLKNAVLYPTTWLYLLLPLFTAFKLHYLVHVLLGWLGLYVLGRSYAQSRRAAFLGASLFAFSGMYLSSFEFYNHIAALAWMPWILWLLHRDSPAGRGRVLLLTGLWTLLILAGAPEFALMTIILAAGQAFFVAGGWRKKIVPILLPLALAILVSAVQLLPSIELLGRTDRSSHAAQWPLELIQLLDLPFPHILGNDRDPGHHDFWGGHLFDQHVPLYYSLYMGVGALTLAFWGLKRPGRRRQKILLALTVIFFLLACGRYSPFFFLYQITPVLSSIRYPIKFFMGAILCLSSLAGFGFDRVMSGGRRPGRRPWPFAAAAAALGLIVFVLFKKAAVGALNTLFLIDQDASFRALEQSIETGLVLLAVYGLAVFLLRRVTRPAPVLGWALLAVAVLDPAVHNRYVNPTVPASDFAATALPGMPAAPLAVCRDEIYFPDLKQAVADDVKLHRFFRESLYPFTGLGEGIRYVLNWDFYGTYSRGYRELRDTIRALPPAGQLKVLRSVGCAAYLGREPLFSKATARRLQIQGNDVWLERIPGANEAPFAAFEAVRATGIRDKLGFFLADGFDPRRTVIAADDLGLPAPSGHPPAEQGTITVQSEAQGRGRYSVSLPRDGVVVFVNNAGPGWRARVDGESARVLEANLFAKGVRVPAGAHEVELRYLPASFLWGGMISLASIAALPVGAGLLGRQAKRKARRASL